MEDVGWSSWFWVKQQRCHQVPGGMRRVKWRSMKVAGPLAFRQRQQISKDGSGINLEMAGPVHSSTLTWAPCSPCLKFCFGILSHSQSVEPSHGRSLWGHGPYWSWISLDLLKSTTWGIDDCKWRFWGEVPLRKSKVWDDMTNDYPSNFLSSWTGVTKKMLCPKRVAMWRQA